MGHDCRKGNAYWIKALFAIQSPRHCLLSQGSTCHPASHVFLIYQPVLFATETRWAFKRPERAFEHERIQLRDLLPCCSRKKPMKCTKTLACRLANTLARYPRFRGPKRLLRHHKLLLPMCLAIQVLYHCFKIIILQFWLKLGSLLTPSKKQLNLSLCYSQLKYI